MPRKNGLDYYAGYFDKKAPKHKRNSKRRPASPATRVLEFTQESMKHFTTKYGIKPKLILMSKEMKEVINSRVRGKSFLKRISIVTTNKLQGYRTIHITERKEVIKL